MTTRERVRRILADGRWHTGLELARRCRTQYATGLMSYVRKLRRDEHGGHVVRCVFDAAASRRAGRQVWRYKMDKAG
jgi:hypothetical protein